MIILPAIGMTMFWVFKTKDTSQNLKRLILQPFLTLAGGQIVSVLGNMNDPPGIVVIIGISGLIGFWYSLWNYGSFAKSLPKK